ncbi:MAG: TolC family protein [Burkholderiales bacterium]
MIASTRIALESRRMALAAMLLIGGCAPANYSPRTIDPDAAPAAFATRTPAQNGLAQLVVASGYEGDWPPDQWRLETLVLVALHFNPEIESARAQNRVAQAELVSAAQQRPLALQFAAEHHSRQVESNTPWSLGLALELPLVGPGRRAARVERAAALAEVSELGIAAAAWRVRAAVRDALIDLEASRGRERVIESQLAARREMADLVAKRVAAGMLSARELGQEQTAVAELEVALDTERGRGSEAMTAMARALGLPLETVQQLRLAGDTLADHVEVPGAGAIRAAALRNRLDIVQRLLEFGAADAEVKFAVAAQYPEVKLSPGYLWDQGDNVWSLAASLLFPPGSSAQAAVREAQARRELAAQRFTALQTQVIGEAEQASALHDAARLRAGAADRRWQSAQEECARVRRLFEAGAADRVELAAARIVSLAAQTARHAAAIERKRAVARLEDVMQRPLLAEFHRLPDVAGKTAEPQR